MRAARTNLPILVYNGGTITTRDILTLRPEGYVGINTSSPLGRLTIRSGYSEGANSGLCLDASDPTVYNLKLYSFVQGGGQVGYNFQVNNISSSVNALTFGYNGNIGLNTTSPACKLDVV